MASLLGARILAILLFAAGALIACKKESDTAPAKPASAPIAPLPPSDASVAIALDATASASACEPQHFAVAGACPSGGRCVLMYEVDATCTVQLRKELVMSDVAREVLDIAWPKRDGALYLVAQRETKPTWAWGTLDTPLAATAAAIEKIAWKDEKIGVPDPEGFQYGVETDGGDAVLATCSKWTQPGGEEGGEEWSCDQPTFWSIANKTFTKGVPVSPFTKAYADGSITEKVTLKKTKQGLACTFTGGESATLKAHVTGVPLATVALSPDTYFILRLSGVGRGDPNPHLVAVAMRGCGEHPTLRGETIPGPAGLWLSRQMTVGNDDEVQWKVYRGDIEVPLLGGDGKPFGMPGNAAVWTSR